jgi:hypothetical protein
MRRSASSPALSVCFSAMVIMASVTSYALA